MRQTHFPRSKNARKCVRRLELRRDGAFVVDDYQHAAPLSSFFPGIAGLWGRPLWVFYVNRGQAIASVGCRDKDHPILEFQPANKAYRLTPTHGFRTFIKRLHGRRPSCYEPFRVHAPDAAQRLTVTASELALEETHRAHQLRVAVRYFAWPNEPVAALVRVLSLTNLGRRPQLLELLDGLPVIVPYGCSEWFLKHMSRTIEAWVAVTNLARHAPVFRLKVEPHDRPDVVPITEGNFYACWQRHDARLRPLPVVVEAHRVFGAADDLAEPDAFWSATPFRMPTRQQAANQMPSAFAYTRAELARGATLQLVSVIGHVRDERQLNAYLARIDGACIDRKAQENRAVIQRLQDQALTVTDLPAFDRYAQQSFLDNGLRGGFPVAVGPRGRDTLLYLFGRKHGDLERDYNQFVLEPTPCSQGNANFRDVVQNRRSDGWIYPEAAAQNLATFFGLIQLDGFNPLVYTGARFRIAMTSALRGTLRQWMPAELLDAFTARITQPVTPGEILVWLQDRGIALNDDTGALLAALLGAAERCDGAEHGEGFWSDHWTYTLDTLEQFATLYPDRLRALFSDERRFAWFDNAHVVAPRSDKYVLVQGRVRQVGAVRQDAEKLALQRARSFEPQLVRAQQGRGDIYRSSFVVKLVILLLNKLASLDPAGVGIEMEADKPNWYDALNGLPALFGSSISETCELLRAVRWLEEMLGALQLPAAHAWSCPREAATFLHRLQDAASRYLASSAGDRDLQYWDMATTAKEEYRAAIRLGVDGAEQPLTVAELLAFLALARQRLDGCAAKAFDRTARVYRTYCWYAPTAYEVIDAATQRVRVRAFTRHWLPLFLEGNVHALRIAPDQASAAKLHHAVTRSPLYDRKLKMYKVTESLAKAPLEIGRARVFTPGWLEHESVWLHMEYKYLLELLRAGLAEEFFKRFTQAATVFQPPRRYGRSPLENSSFLVSSAYADPSLHGRGFVARLTGATAEFLDMWRRMMVGAQPFVVDGQGSLTCQPSPALPGWLFTRRATTVTFTRRSGRQETVELSKHTVSFLLFGEALVTYHNPARRATYGQRAARPQVVRLLTEGRWLEWSGGVVPAPYAERLRAGDVSRVEVMLGKDKIRVEGETFSRTTIKIRAEERRER